MAEFIGVVHTIQRICKRANGRCPACLLGGFACPNNVRFDKTDEAAFQELEDIVIKWAEEHPEPEYPSWYDYLHSIGVLYNKHTAGGDVTEICWGYMMAPIDDDTAKKLGLQPKEGL